VERRGREKEMRTELMAKKKKTRMKKEPTKKMRS
jgi:hypothetical protein